MTAQLLVWFPSSETSGDTITDAIRGIQIRPADVGDGSIGFTIANAVTILNNSSELSTPLHAGTWPLLDLSKVLLHAAIIKTVDGRLSKITIGNDDVAGSKFSLSFSSIMHLILRTADAYLNYNLGSLALGDGVDHIIYEMWDGPTKTLSAKVLSLSGELSASILSPYSSMSLSYTYAGLPDGFSGPDPDSFASVEAIQPDPGTRTSNIHCYGWGLWQFDSPPDDLDSWLISLAEKCVTGNKSDPWYPPGRKLITGLSMR